jgi:hypothetical protein
MSSDPKLKPILKLLFDFIVALGALACVLQWLGVRPKDIGSVLRFPVPRWIWLVIAILLFAWNMYDIVLRAKSTLLRIHLRSRPTTTVRLIEGYFGFRKHIPTVLVILLNVRVDGPPGVTRGWTLTLARADSHVYNASQQPMPEPVAFRSLADATGGDAEPARPAFFEAVPIPTHTPDKGWLLFTIDYPPKEFHDHIFGTTFALVATDDRSQKFSCVRQPGDWLHRAVISN